MSRTGSQRATSAAFAERPKTSVRNAEIPFHDLCSRTVVTSTQGPPNSRAGRLRVLDRCFARTPHSVCACTRWIRRPRHRRWEPLPGPNPRWLRDWTSRAPATRRVGPPVSGLSAFYADRDTCALVRQHTSRAIVSLTLPVAPPTRLAHCEPACEAPRTPLLSQCVNTAGRGARSAFHRQVPRSIRDKPDLLRRPPLLFLLGRRNAASDMGSRARGAR